MKDPAPILKELARKQGSQPARLWATWFILSAGGILAYCGANNVLEFFMRSQALELTDPLLGLSFHYLLPVVGLAELVVACLCLFSNKQRLALVLVVWLVVNFGVYRVGLWTMGWQHPWVFVGGLRDALGISPLLADAILFQVALYLLAGSIVFLLYPQRQTVTAPVAGPAAYHKVHCSSCGGKTAFDGKWIGQIIPCPHCGNPLALDKPT